MTSLDGRITELKQHIEIPENEEQIKALQEKIEGFERSQYGVWYEREEDTYRSKRIREEGGIEVSDLLDEISEYKYNTQTQKIDQRVSSKVQYLEQKLAILTEHKDKNFGNARDVRNYLKHIMDRQINRITKNGVSSKMDLVTIRMEDVTGVSLGGGISK